MLNRIIIFIFSFLPFMGTAANGYFVENTGQFPSKVLYQARLNYGSFFIEKDRFTCVVLSPDQVDEKIGHAAHDHHQKHHKSFSPISNDIKGQSFSILFENGNQNPQHLGKKPLNFKVNSLIGNNPEHWGQNLKPFQEILLKEVYPNTDLKVYFKDNSIKYDFILRIGAKASDIRLKYEGLNKIKFSQNQLELQTQVGSVYDQAPYSYTVSNPSQKIETKFKKINATTFGLVINQDIITETLIIDPQLNFVTFTGSSIDNWGYTATNDKNGYGYAGGVTFGTGYPISLGAFQSSFGGGSIDISISKFSPDGKNLIYSTYIGGSGLEAPHSMVVNSKNELVIYGVTSSTNYPATGYDQTFNGGTTVLASNVLDFVGGTDIIITVLNSSGSGITGSTYYGGSGNDALNDVAEVSGLFHNYGDVYRGEVTVDPNDNIIISSVTSSTNLPTPGGFQTSYGGGNQDGCIAMFTPNTSNIIWGSYFGGSGDDACYASKQNSSGDIYFTGGTTSNNLPTSVNAVTPNSGGAIDGYLARVSSNGGTLKSCTYIATSAYDQSYFVEVDYDDDVYCFGQSLGNMPVSSGTYSVSNSGQFLQKFNPDLSNIEASTVIGSGTNASNIVPGAFMVSNCKEVYISGWGGVVNYNAGGTTNGLPTTSDAVQSNTDGSDFYLALLGPDFSSLKYATFLGGIGLAEHVDGGTSRFDRDGTVYQAVCAGCGGSSAFPVTPGAYSTTNNSVNCNLALIKMDISKLTANIKFEKDSVHCKNDPVNFANQSTGGTEYKWIYPDGSVSLGFDGEYYFDATGDYVVSLVAIDSTQCPYSDTADINVKIITIPEISINLDTFICLNNSLFIEATGGPNDTNYRWWTDQESFPDNENNITITPLHTETYFVEHTNECGQDIQSIEIPVYTTPVGLSREDTICLGNEAVFQFINSPDYQTTISNGLSYELKNDSIYFSPISSSNFEFETNGLCGDAIDTFDITVIEINPEAGPDTLICPGERVQLYAEGGDEYEWQSTYFLSDSSIQYPFANPQETHNYIVKITKDICYKFDTAHVQVYPKPYQPIEPEYTINYGDYVDIDLDNNYSYNWTPATYLSCKTCPNVTSTPEEDIMYYFTYNDNQSCSITDSIKINVIFELWIPNTFTPNSDGRNELFYAYSHLIQEFEMDIFDRWGNHIFYSNNINNGWDGTFNQRPQQQDVYVWKIRYKKVHSNKTYERVGHVNLIR